MEVEPTEAHEVEPSEPVILKKRGRPKGSLNKKTVAKMREDVLPDSSLHHDREIPAIEDHTDGMVLDVDFTSDEILGEPTPKRKPKAPRARDPPTEPHSEDDSPPPPPPPLTRQRSLRVKTTPRESDIYREPEPVYPASYLEVLTRGLKEARAKQYAEKVAQYDRFVQW